VGGLEEMNDKAAGDDVREHDHQQNRRPNVRHPDIGHCTLGLHNSRDYNYDATAVRLRFDRATTIWATPYVTFIHLCVCVCVGLLRHVA